MAKIKLPPSKKQSEAQAAPAPPANEKKIQDVINKGGSTTKQTEVESTPEEDLIKNFNIKILQSELNIITELRKKRPKPRGQSRLGISLQAWLEEAITEKIDREKKKYNI